MKRYTLGTSEDCMGGTVGALRPDPAGEWVRFEDMPPANPDDELQRLRALVKKGYDVVNDFLPNIDQCAIQDYGRLNEFMIEARKVQHS